MPQIASTGGRSQVDESADLMAGLRAALMKRKKNELVDALLHLAQDDRKISRRLTAQFEVDVAPNQLIETTRQAIADATAFDPRQINRNFDYDYEAYATVERNFARLIDAGQLSAAMQLSLELMKAGSHQIEMSDEGMMTDDVEACLNVVITALAKSNLPEKDIAAWCDEMRRSDRIRCVAEKQLKALRAASAAEGDAD